MTCAPCALDRLGLTRARAGSITRPILHVMDLISDAISKLTRK